MCKLHKLEVKTTSINWSCSLAGTSVCSLWYTCVTLGYNSKEKLSSTVLGVYIVSYIIFNLKFIKCMYTHTEKDLMRWNVEIST